MARTQAPDKPEENTEQIDASWDTYSVHLGDEIISVKARSVEEAVSKAKKEQKKD